ncbi:hypothetical protein ACFL14_02400 [Patescibacteria group bacterium]
MEFKVHPSSDEYKKMIWEKVNFFWDNPGYLKSLSRSIYPILVKILDQYPSLSLETDKTLKKLGRADRHTSIERAIWLLLVWADLVYKSLPYTAFQDQSVRKEVFYKLKDLITGLNSEFVELVLGLWLKKLKDGDGSFYRYWSSLDQHWQKLDADCSDFFIEPSSKISKPVIPIRGPDPIKSKPKSSGRRSFMKKKEEVGV